MQLANAITVPTADHMNDVVIFFNSPDGATVSSIVRSLRLTKGGCARAMVARKQNTHSPTISCIIFSLQQEHNVEQ